MTVSAIQLNFYLLIPRIWRRGKIFNPAKERQKAGTEKCEHTHQGYSTFWPYL